MVYISAHQNLNHKVDKSLSISIENTSNMTVAKDNFRNILASKLSQYGYRISKRTEPYVLVFDIKDVMVSGYLPSVGIGIDRLFSSSYYLYPCDAAYYASFTFAKRIYLRLEHRTGTTAHKTVTPIWDVVVIVEDRIYRERLEQIVNAIVTQLGVEFQGDVTLK